MSDNYKGWKLFDTVTIVSRPITKWDYKTNENISTGECKGFLVDPKNKKQLESALSWGTSYEYEYGTNEEGQRICIDKHEVKPEQHTYDNKGFTLELSEAAEQSSQGGKLSFWNCWIIAPDGKRFLIGIAANLLLDVLKSTTVINGVVQEKLMFARCKGGVGMLSENMNSYKDALDDESARNNKSKGKTSKHKVGYVYETLTQKNVYLGDFYRWYEQIWEVRPTKYFPYHEAKQLVGFRKLDKPVVVKWFPAYYEDESVDYYINHFGCWNLEDKLPARKETIQLTELPDKEKCIEKITADFYDCYNDLIECQKKGLTRAKHINAEYVGLSTNKDEYTLPEVIKTFILECDYILK